jgi:hypothetical protein
VLDGGLIIELMDKGLVKEIRTPEKSFHNTSDDKFMMTLDFGIAKKYVDDLSVNVKRGNRAKLERGGWPNYAPLGYTNDRLTKTMTSCYSTMSGSRNCSISKYISAIHTIPGKRVALRIGTVWCVRTFRKELTYRNIQNALSKRLRNGSAAARWKCSILSRRMKCSRSTARENKI